MSRVHALKEFAENVQFENDGDPVVTTTAPPPLDASNTISQLHFNDRHNVNLQPMLLSKVQFKKEGEPLDMVTGAVAISKPIRN